VGAWVFGAALGAFFGAKSHPSRAAFETWQCLRSMEASWFRTYYSETPRRRILALLRILPD
jgi:hypothetical protein